MPSRNKKRTVRSRGESHDERDRDPGVSRAVSAGEEDLPGEIQLVADTLLAEGIGAVVIDYQRYAGQRQQVEGVYIVPLDVPDTPSFEELVTSWPEDRIDHLFEIEAAESSVQTLVNEVCAAIWDTSFSDIPSYVKNATLIRRTVFFCCKSLELAAEQAVLYDTEYSTLLEEEA